MNLHFEGSRGAVEALNLVASASSQSRDIFDLMVELKQAIAVATEFAKAHIDGVDFRLEEIESSDINGNPVWVITLSNALRKTDLQKLFSGSGQLGADPSREYRTFAVVKSTGEIESMKMRIFATP